MEHWREILGIVASAATGLCLIFMWLLVRRQNRILEGDDDSLRRNILDSSTNDLLRLRCIDKLRERGVDIHFAAPVVAQLALSDKKKERYLVWFMTRDVFPELYADADYEYRNPSPTSRLHLEGIAAQLEKNASATYPRSAPPDDAQSAL